MAMIMAILHQAIMANFNKIPQMAIIVRVDMAINMVNIGVYAKKRKNVVKEELKYLHQLKS